MTYQELTRKPKAKARPRFTVLGNGKVVTFTEAKTRAAEEALAAQWTEPAYDGPISVYLILSDNYVGVEVRSAVDPISKKLRADIDNYAKLVLDALNGVAWVDDKQIVHLEVRKL